MGTLQPGVRDLIARYVAELGRLGVTPTRVVVFGSQARGTAGPLSDIDLLIVSPAFETLPPPERPRLLARANRTLLAPIQALWTTPAALDRADSASFLRTVIAEGLEFPLAG